MARKKKATQTQQADLGSIFRAALNMGAGALVTKGVITSAMVEPITGGLLALASVAMSMHKNRAQSTP